MKTLPLVLMAVSLVSFQAHAQEFAQGVSEDTVTDRDLDSGLKSMAVELSAQTFGDFGSSNNLKTFDPNSTGHTASQYRPTDGMLSVTFRQQLSADWDVSATAPLYSHAASAPMNQSGTSFGQILIYPVSIGMRYHFNALRDTVRPFLQADLGEAIISDSTLSNSGGEDYTAGDSSIFLRPFGKITAGANFYFSPRSTIYVGVKAGYLAMSEYGSLVTGLDVGYAF